MKSKIEKTPKRWHRLFSKSKKVNSRLDENGTEVLDKRPMSVAIGHLPPPSLEQMVARYTANAIARLQQSSREDELVDAFDFEPPSEDDFYSPHELIEDPVTGREVTRAEAKYIEANARHFDKIVKEKKEAAKKDAELEKRFKTKIVDVPEKEASPRKEKENSSDRKSEE